MSEARKRAISPDDTHCSDSERVSAKCRIVSAKCRIGNDAPAAIEIESARLRAMPRCFEPARHPPPLAETPKKVVVLMRHGDRTCIPKKAGKLDLSHLESVWERLMPTAEEQVAMDRVPVQVSSGHGNNAYAKFVGERPWGQLTSLGVAQCRAVGAELKRRYPSASIHAFSTNFPRTKQSAAAVLLGFGAGESIPVVVRSPSDEVLLPNFDGRCQRYSELRASLIAEAKKTSLRQMCENLEPELRSLVGEDPLNGINLDFRALCVYEDVVGVVPGLNWPLMQRVEQYVAAIDGVVFKNLELVRLGCGRLLRWVMDLLAEPGHEVALLLAHDNMLTAFLMAISVFKWEQPTYASAVVLETADFEGELKVRVHVNNEIRRDWVPWKDFVEPLESLAMTHDQYEALCSCGS